VLNGVCAGAVCERCHTGIQLVMHKCIEKLMANQQCGVEHRRRRGKPVPALFYMQWGGRQEAWQQVPSFLLLTFLLSLSSLFFYTGLKKSKEVQVLQ